MLAQICDGKLKRSGRLIPVLLLVVFENITKV